MLEDGAYNRLLRLCWRTPGCKMPNDMAWIFRQVRAVSKDDKAAVATVLGEFFTRGRGKIWNERLLEVHVQVSVAHENKSEAGKKGAAAKALKSNKTEASTAKPLPKQPLSNQTKNQSQTEIEEGGGGGAGEISTFREQILSACNVDPVSGLTGQGGRQLGTQADMAEANRWLELPGMTADAICAEVSRLIKAKRDGPPATFKYFTDAMQRLSGALTQPALIPTAGTRNDKPSHQQFDTAHREYARRVSAGAIDRGPDPSNPFAA